MRRKNKCSSDALESSPSSLVSMSSGEPSIDSTEDDNAHLVVNSNASTSKRSGDEPKHNIFNLDDVGNNHFRDKENRKYCRSYSKSLIQVISQWTCAHCSSQKFDKCNLPMIISCGHYVSEGCVRRELEGAGGNFKCEICNDFFPANQEFLPDEVLSDFFKAIEENGYRCHKDCTKMHDLTNIVHFPGGGDSEYWCVWCACKNHQDVGKLKASINNDLVLMATSSATERLTSLNRINHVSGWALDACCICRKELRNDKNTDIVHFSCNHIGHKVCPGYKKEPNDMVKCLLCTEPPVKRSTLTERKWHGKHYLKDYTQEKYFECGTCRQSHPLSNFYPPSSPRSLFNKMRNNSVKCVWCTVETFGPKTNESN